MVEEEALLSPEPQKQWSPLTFSATKTERESTRKGQPAQYRVPLLSILNRSGFCVWIWSPHVERPDYTTFTIPQCHIQKDRDSYKANNITSVHSRTVLQGTRRGTLPHGLQKVLPENMTWL